MDLTPVDAGGSGMSGGLAKTEYSKDGGATWSTGTSVTYGVWKRGGGSGLHTLLYRSTDAAGNLESTQSCEVKMDARAPVRERRSARPAGGSRHRAPDRRRQPLRRLRLLGRRWSPRLDGGAPQTGLLGPSRSPAPACTGSPTTRPTSPATPSTSSGAA